MKDHKHLFRSMLMIFILFVAMASAARAQPASRMTKEKLKGMFGNTDLVILDVRTGRDWKSSEFKIKGAVRENPYDFDSWSGRYEKDKTLVLYCA